MLQKVGRRPPAATPAQFLLECHERIRALLGVARRIAEATGAPEREIAEAAEGVRKYFSSAFLLHARDEEEILLPRLCAGRPALAQALAPLRTQHEDHEHPLGQLIAVCAQLATAPGRLDAMRAELRAATEALAAVVEPHLAWEEALLLPALEAELAPEEQAALLAEMQRRRG
jgi:iron-sulfur cluster repair protein YtfE (RIC family)